MATKVYQTNPVPMLPSDVEQRVLGIYMADGDNVLAARAAGITTRQLLEVIAAHPQFASRVEEARQFPVEYAKMALFKKATRTRVVRRKLKPGGPEQEHEEFDGDTIALIFYLKNRAGYADRRELSGNLQHNHNHFALLVEASYNAQLPAGPAVPVPARAIEDGAAHTVGD